MMFRPFTRDDRAVYLSMTEQFYASPAVSHSIPTAYREACFEELLKGSPYAEGFLFEENGEPCGYALLAKTYSQEAGGIVYWIEELFVLPELRGKGIGRRFFSWLAENRPAARLRLEVEPDNAGAVRLYERVGFVHVPYGQMWLEENTPNVSETETFG